MMNEELRRARLQAMGIALWKPRAASTPNSRADSMSPVPPAGAVVETPFPGAADDDAFGPMHDPDAEPPTGKLNEPLPDSFATPLAHTDSERVAILALDLAALRAQVSVCTSCDLHRSRTQTVFGVGDHSARLVVIGEAPGADEDVQGEPFVGRAGKLLNAMLMGIGLRREQVYITNILKCRPPRNRDPHADEVANCGFYLQQQISFVAPELILAVGRVAAQNLLGVTTPIGELRGRTHTYAASAIPVVVTYHPAYLLRSPLEKRRAWQDLKMVAARLGIEP